MPEYLSPGVYIEETQSGPRPIEGISTTTAAFVGFAPSGPANTPVFVSNWQQFKEAFGSLDGNGEKNPYMDGAYLAHSVYAYFNNGGTRCYVVRLAPPTDASTGKVVDAVKPLQLPTRASKAVPSLSIAARDGRTSDIQIEVLPPSADALKPQEPGKDGKPGNPNQKDGKDAPRDPEEGNDGLFTLKVTRDGQTETFENVSIGKKHSRNVTEVINRESVMIQIEDASNVGPLVERAPEAGTYVLRADSNPIVHAKSLKGRDFVGSVDARSGIEGLEIADDVSMIAVPDLMSAYQAGLIDRDGVKAVQRALIDHCERNQNRIAILDTLPDLTAQQAQHWRNVETNFDSSYAAMYYPWMKVDGPNGQPVMVPPSGFVAGIYARNDVERGVHKAPANEIVRGALGPAMQITKGEQDILNPIGVNCIREFPGLGLRVWGARTLSSDARWRYVSVRRLFNFIEKSIENGTQWAVFEPNDENLWSKIRRDINAFLTTVWRDGALFGTNAREAFYVKCDAELNPPEIRDRGILQIEIGLAPVKPAEFIAFRFSQYAGGGQ
ncbi:phage tail sheath family protein [Deinococcus maricopensis]|uniref:Putative phage tail sheath protein n=1 Tax=Deinococcus maricopensis (strain DSM 21211 / LMG 22137 / NRRL B-23946 / LB-34) TaxID=709986 RepID=E8U3N8_DEIML|nr:phage tail sheath subtilisin-like domain-containing protein [Deinococcus maricopensis]ADV68662.1 putative phage tail sheath protein [Deinococcus maricopensis DSM 21211]